MSAADRADELARMDDLWPEIRHQITAAMGDAGLAVDRAWNDVHVGDLEDKFRAGEAEHGRDWLRMSRADLEREIRAEIHDLVLYHAMVRARWMRQIAPSFIAHRDLGDEQPEGKEA